MKKILQILLLSLILVSCSTDDHPSDKNSVHNIIFSISSTDNDRLSQIDLKIINADSEIYHTSYSNEHLPLTRNFQNQKLKEFSTLEIGYIDNSAGAVGEPFEPYSLTLEITVDAKVVAKKELTITEAGQVDFVNYSFR